MYVMAPPTARLRRVAAHLSTAGEPRTGPTAGLAAELAAAQDPAPLRLLSDAEMQRFVGEGFVTLPVAEQPPAFHAAIHGRAEELFSSQLNYGNTRNIYPVIPELEHIMHGPTVAGALTSVLGEDYVMDRRKHMHNSSSQGEQKFHKDCQRGKSLTGHFPRCCMIFYVPAGCTASMGPTEILPGSHCLRTLLPAELDTDAECQVWDPSGIASDHLSPQKLVTPLREGTITMVHYDLVHRGTARFEDTWTDDAPFRPMFKFLYNRTVAPTRHSWDCRTAVTPSFDESLPPPMRPVAHSVWEWLAGSLPPPPEEDPLAAPEAAALYATGQGNEADRIGCAYSLGRRAWHGDDRALEALTNALADPSDSNARRAAMHGLAAAGDSVVPALIQALGNAAGGLAGRTAQAAEALGEAARTPSLAVVAALAGAMEQLRARYHTVVMPDETAGNMGENSADYPVLTQAVAFCTDSLKHVAQRLHAQLLVDGCEDAGTRAIVAALLAALAGHVGDGDIVRECRGKALLSLCVLPRSAWADNGAALAAGLVEVSQDPSQYAEVMGKTGLARMARAEALEGGAVGRAREAVLARQAELRYIALDNNGLH